MITNILGLTVLSFMTSFQEFFGDTIPVAEWVDTAVEKITDTFSWFFDPIKNDFGDFIEGFADLLAGVPAIIIIAIMVVIAFFISGKRIALPIFTLLGLLLFITNNFGNN